jgi:hypothetical protein
MYRLMPLLLLGTVLYAGSTAVVLEPVANMYSKPSEEADVVSQAIYGATVSVLEKQDGWKRVRTADAYTGWMPEGALRAGSYPGAGRVAEVGTLFAHIYREASVTRHQPLLTLPFEARLAVTSEPEDDGARWIEVRLADGRSGWVQRGNVAFQPERLDLPAMLAFSKRFLGLPYTWGGTSSFGYDCSGFTQMLFRRRGIMLPRDAQPQAKWTGAVAVSRDRLQPGDLLYFGNSENQINHTGVYLGDGKFINATTYHAPEVRIDDLEDPHWARLLVACRRVRE